MKKQDNIIQWHTWPAPIGGSACNLKLEKLFGIKNDVSIQWIKYRLLPFFCFLKCLGSGIVSKSYREDLLQEKSCDLLYSAEIQGLKFLPPKNKCPPSKEAGAPLLRCTIPCRLDYFFLRGGRFLSSGPLSSLKCPLR